MKKVIICFFCLMFVQSSFGYVKVKSLGTLRSGTSSYNTGNTYSTGNTYTTGNTYNTSYKRVSTPTRMASMNGNIGVSVTPKTNVKLSGSNVSSASTNNWATQSQINALDSLVTDLESQMGNFQTGLDTKSNVTDVYTKTEVDDKIDAITTTGTPGADGLSAYQIAVNNGFIGSEVEWMASLKGDPGEKGDKGDQGDPGTSIPFGCESGDGSYLLTVDGGITSCKYVVLTSDNFVE